MRSLIGLAAFGCAVGVRARGLYKWSRGDEARNWHPARETPDLGYLPLLGSGPLPTAPPKVDEKRLRNRAATENTCAYVGGQADRSLSCGIDSACVLNSLQSKVGCCPDTSLGCPIWTTCYDLTESSKYTTNNGYSLWCGDSTYPRCLTHKYASDDIFSGYTLLGCGQTAGSDVVYYTSTGRAAPTTTTTRPRSTDSTTTPGTVTTTSAPPTTTAASSSGGAPVGAIAGGVVGGVAALSLIALGVFFIIRRGKQPRDGGAHSAAGISSAQGQSPAPGSGMMTEQPLHQANYSGFAPVDNRSSIAKGPYYDASVVSSPPTGPSPHGPAPMFQQYAAGAPSQPQHYAPGMGHQSGPVPANYHAAELDTNRGDRELRELE